jgi:repressor LexA
MNPLTDKQRKVFEFIEKYSQKHDRSPTFEEIQSHFEYKSLGTVHDYVSALKEKGYIGKSSRRWNSLELMQTATSVPLLGKVAAGRPIQYFKTEEKLEVPQDMAREMGKFFALQVLGDSMIDEGILENDFVIIRKQPSVENGQIVVASIENEATIKYFYKKKNQIELHSANQKYAPILISSEQDFKIEGLFRGLIRKVF